MNYRELLRLAKQMGSMDELAAQAVKLANNPPTVSPQELTRARSGQIEQEVAAARAAMADQFRSPTLTRAPGAVDIPLDLQSQIERLRTSPSTSRPIPSPEQWKIINQRRNYGTRENMIRDAEMAGALPDAALELDEFPANTQVSIPRQYDPSSYTSAQLRQMGYGPTRAPAGSATSPDAPLSPDLGQASPTPRASRAPREEPVVSPPIPEWQDREHPYLMLQAKRHQDYFLQRFNVHLPDEEALRMAYQDGNFDGLFDPVKDNPNWSQSFIDEASGVGTEPQFDMASRIGAAPEHNINQWLNDAWEQAVNDGGFSQPRADKLRSFFASKFEHGDLTPEERAYVQTTAPHLDWLLKRYDRVHPPETPLTPETLVGTQPQPTEVPLAPAGDRVYREGGERPPGGIGWMSTPPQRDLSLAELRQMGLKGNPVPSDWSQLGKPKELDEVGQLVRPMTLQEIYDAPPSALRESSTARLSQRGPAGWETLAQVENTMPQHGTATRMGMDELLGGSGIDEETRSAQRPSEMVARLGSATPEVFDQAFTPEQWLTDKYTRDMPEEARRMFAQDVSRILEAERKRGQSINKGTTAFNEFEGYNSEGNQLLSPTERAKRLQATEQDQVARKQSLLQADEVSSANNRLRFEDIARDHPTRWNLANQIGNQWDYYSDPGAQASRLAGAERMAAQKGYQAPDPEMYMDAFYNLPDKYQLYILDLVRARDKGAELNQAEQELLRFYDQASEL